MASSTAHAGMTYQSDESILGIGADAPSPGSAESSSAASSRASATAAAADAAEAELAALDSDLAPREDTHASRDPQRDADANDERANDDSDKAAQRADEQKDSRAETGKSPLPVGSLEEFDAGFFSGDSAARAALAGSLYKSDPEAFRAMFEEAARVLGVTTSPRAEAADRAGDVAETLRSPALNAQNQDGSPKASATKSEINSAQNATPNEPDAVPNATNAQPATFPTETYRAFESQTNDAVARDVRGEITRTLEQVLPEGVAAGAAKRIGEDIFGEIGKVLAADAQLSSNIGEALRGWKFGSAEQQQVVSLLAGRARQILPSVARRVIGEWTSSVLSTARTRATRSEAAARRVDVGGAASGDAAGRGAARAMRPREIDYARTSDDDIFSM